MPSLIVFLDSSVIVSSLISSTGGSNKIIQSGKSSAIKLITSQYVVEEVTKHLPKINLSKSTLSSLIQTRDIDVLPNPPQKVISKFTSITPDPKDEPILASAVLSGANVLVSLDKKHILIPKVRKHLKPIKVYNPQQFWARLDKLFPSS